MEQFIWVRGVSYCQEKVKEIDVGDPVLFERDSENQHDPNATQVLVLHRGVTLHVGFVPAELCTSLLPYIENMEDGRGRNGYWNAQVITKEERDGNWVLQVSFEVDGFLPRQSGVGTRGGS